MLNCKQTSQLVSQSMERKLSMKERFAVKMHLLICKYCMRFYRQVNAIKKLMHHERLKVEQNTDISLSGEAKARIEHLLRDKR